MSSQAGKLTLKQDQDLIPVRDNTQEASQRKAIQMWRIHLWSHDQATMVHQVNTGKRHPNGNSTSTICLSGPTGVTTSDFLSPTSGHIYQAVIQIRNCICWKLRPPHICTSKEQPTIRIDNKFKAIFWFMQPKTGSDNWIFSRRQRTIISQQLHHFIIHTLAKISHCGVNAQFHNK